MIGDLVRRLIGVNTPADVAAEVVVDAFEAGLMLSSNVREMSADSPQDMQDIKEDIRARWRAQKRTYRENRKQNQQSAKANDVAVSADMSSDMSSKCPQDMQDIPCESYLSSSDSPHRRKKKTGDARARASRIPPDWQPTEADAEFARQLGVDPKAARDEFVDYWIAIPGSRGTKLNWSATFRNRVREVAGRRNGRAPPRAAQNGFAAIAARFAEQDQQHAAAVNQDRIHDQHGTHEPELFAPGDPIPFAVPDPARSRHR